MAQKIIKIILVSILTIILCIILWYGLSEYGNKGAINECRSYIGKNLKNTDGTYVKLLNFLCLLSEGNAQLILPGEVDYIAKNYESSLVYFDLQNSLKIFLSKVQNKLIESPFNETDTFDSFHICLIMTPGLSLNSFVFLDNIGITTQFKDNYSEYVCFNKSYTFMSTEAESNQAGHSTLGILIDNKNLQNIDKDIYLQLYFFPSNISINATLLKQDLARYNNINNVQYIIHNK